MLKMHQPRGGRRTEQQIKDEVLRHYQADLIAGFAEISEWARAHRERQWVASFTDARAAYYVHQTGADHLQFWTEPVPAHTDAKWVVFLLSVGMGMGDVLPQPAGRFEVRLSTPAGASGPLVSFCVSKENRVWRRGEVTLAYDIKRRAWAADDVVMKMDAHITEESCATYGLMALRIPKRLLRPGERARIDVVPICRQPSRRWFKVDVDMFARPVWKCDIDAVLAAACSDPHPPQAHGLNVYFGDLHVHSGEEHGTGRSCGLGTLAENYEYARDVAGLDVLSITDHDWQMKDQDDWRTRQEQMDEWNDNGRFVVIPGYEWTSARYGHRNVYYRSTGWPWFDSNVGGGHNQIADNSPSPTDLWRALRECGAPALTIAHHSSTGFFPVDWHYMDPQFDRLVEVYSTWGNSEYLGAPYGGYASDRHPGMGALDALRMGHRLGLMASSDGHDGCPGNANWSHRQPHLHHRLGSGFIAVLADELTREAIWDAMYARRCYATTGTRIVLSFSVNGAVMGSEIAAADGEARVIEAQVQGTAPLQRLELVKSGVVVYEQACRGMDASIDLAEADAAGPAFYYLRVFQSDGEMAWSSPVWVDPA